MEYTYAIRKEILREKVERLKKDTILSYKDVLKVLK